MRYILNFQDIELASPIFLGAGLFLAALMLIGVFLKPRFTKGKGIPVSEADFSLKPGFSAASIAYRVKAALVAFMIILVGVIASGPFTQSFEGAIRTESTQKLRTTVAVLDVSGSMGGKFSFEDVKFNIVRDNLAKLLRRAENMRATVIFFSDKATPIRWFTSDTNALADDVEGLNLKMTNEQRYDDPYLRLGLIQIRKISGGTNTPNGLALAGDMLTALDMSAEELSKSASIILFTDLQDNLDEVAGQVRNFTTRGIRVYVISVGRKAQNAAFEQRTAATNGLVKLYSADNEDDIAHAFEEIGKLESSVVTVEETIQMEKSLVPEFSVVLLIAVLTFILLSETILHTVRGGEE